MAKIIPSRRAGITQIPARVHISSDDTPDEIRRVLEGFPPVIHVPGNFDEDTAFTEQACRRTIERFGGRRADDRPHGSPPKGFVWNGWIGYLMPEGLNEPEEASEIAFVIEILTSLKQAKRATDLEQARRCAWRAGLKAMEATMKFALEGPVLLGEKHQVGRQNANRVRTSNADSRAAAWAKELDARKRGLSKEAQIVRIAAREKKDPEAVKKAIQRYNARVRKAQTSI